MKIKGGIAVLLASAIGLSAPTSAQDSFFYRFKAKVGTQSGGGPTTPPVVTLNLLGGTGLTFIANSPYPFGMNASGTDGSTRFFAHPSAVMCGLQVDQMSGAVSGNIDGSLPNGTPCVLRVVARAGSISGTLLGTSNDVTGTLSGGVAPSPAELHGPWSYTDSEDTPFPDQTFTGTGGVAPYSWTVSNLPSWAEYAVASDTRTMVIRKRASATLEDGPTANVSIVMSDAVGSSVQNGSRNFSLTIIPGSGGTPSLSLPPINALTKGQYHEFALGTSGGNANTRYYATATANLCGLTINAMTGLISGTVSTSIPEGQSCTFQVEARDGSPTGPILTTSSSINADAYSMPVMSGPSSFVGTVAGGFTPQTFTTTGGRTPLDWSISAALPNWLLKVESGDRTSITLQPHHSNPVAPYNGTLTIRATDPDGRTSGNVTFQITVN